MDLHEGMRLYNNRRRKVFEVTGFVSPCNETGQPRELLYRDIDAEDGEYLRRPASEFQGTNRDNLPRFLVLPLQKKEWFGMFGFQSYTHEDQWIAGYQCGLADGPCLNNNKFYKEGYDLGKDNAATKRELDGLVQY
jgi:hypothetical protein